MVQHVVTSDVAYCWVMCMIQFVEQPSVSAHAYEQALFDRGYTQHDRRPKEAELVKVLALLHEAINAAR